MAKGDYLFFLSFRIIVRIVVQEPGRERIPEHGSVRVSYIVCTQCREEYTPSPLSCDANGSHPL